MDRNIDASIVQLGALRVLVAGEYQYKSVWLRDVGLSSEFLVPRWAGALRDTLSLFEPRAGVLPKVLGLDESPNTTNVRSLVARVLHIERPNMLPACKVVPVFRDELGSEAVDSWLLWAHARQQLGLAVDVPQLLGRYTAWRGALLLQPAFSDFQDSSAHPGCAFFTNLLLWKVLATAGSDRAGAVERALEQFWSPALHAYRTVLGDERHRSADGNFMAVHWGLPAAGPRYYEMKRGSGLWPAGTGPGFDTTPAWGDTAWFLGLTNMRDYHGPTVYWVWLTALAGLAARRAGDREGAAQVAAILRAHAADAAGEAVEVEEADRRPVDRFLGYKSERRFLLSAAYVRGFFNTA
jgi:hypothetical protein